MVYAQLLTGSKMQIWNKIYRVHIGSNKKKVITWAMVSHCGCRAHSSLEGGLRELAWLWRYFLEEQPGGQGMVT